MGVCIVVFRRARILKQPMHIYAKMLTLEMGPMIFYTMNDEAVRTANVLRVSAAHAFRGSIGVSAGGLCQNRVF